jgi:hypothetical protein
MIIRGKNSVVKKYHPKRILEKAAEARMGSRGGAVVRGDAARNLFR